MYLPWFVCWLVCLQDYGFKKLQLNFIKMLRTMNSQLDFLCDLGPNREIFFTGAC